MSLGASAGRGLGAMWSPTHVQVTVLQARGLRAKGPGGTSDAYAVIQVGKEKYATSVSERSLGAPVWREEATFELPPLLSSGAVPAAAATLQLTVLHRALLGLDKFLGRAEVDLRELHQDQGRRKTQWYTLKSKPGKKDKERGEIEVNIQFMRNNMTASMLDLSVKDKSRNPFGKLKDKIKGKNKDSSSDTASAIIPSGTPSVDSDDESFSKDKKKKSKIKTLFSKSNLQKTPLSQSMSVLPTSKPDKVLLRPGEFPSRWEDEDNEEESSSTSDVTSHKRTASADPKQLSQISFSLPKKEGLSFFGGLRSKSDSLSRSNLCINGNHVYMEQPETKNETKDSSPSSSPSPQGFRKKQQLFSSTENLAARSPKEPGEGRSASPDRRLSDSFPKDSVKAVDSLKSMSLPSYRPLVGGDARETLAAADWEAAKETKDNKKHDSKKSSLLSLVTGKRDAGKGSEDESTPSILGKEKQDTVAEVQPEQEDLGRMSQKNVAAVASGQGNALNPFEDVQISEPTVALESKSEPKPPVPAARTLQTKAVKPRMEVSPEASPQARLPPSPDPAQLSSVLPSGSAQASLLDDFRCDSEAQASESPSVFSSVSSPIVAPISTSTPTEHFPPSSKGKASPEEPSWFRRTESRKAPPTPPSAVGSLCQPLSSAPQEGAEESPGSRSRERGKAESGQCVLQQQQLLRFSSPEQDLVPSHEEAQEAPFSLALSSGRIASPAEKPPEAGCKHSEGQSQSSVEDVGAMTSAARKATPPHQEVPKHEVVPLNASGGQKKAKKRVSFAEQFLAEKEEEGEKPTGPREEEGDHSQRLAGAGPVAGNALDAASTMCPQSGAPGREPEATEAQLLVPSPKEGSSEDPTSEASSARGTSVFRTEEEDVPGAQYQSKASDREGLLSDPLSDPSSAADVKPPTVADLNSSLPSIPEVASDDERVDEAAEGGTAAKPLAPEAGAAPLSVSPPCLEESEGRSGRARGSVLADSLDDFRLKTPKAAPLEQTAAMEIPEPRLGKSSRVEPQLPRPGASEEEKLEASERPEPSPCTSLDPPGPSSSLSETFPAVYPFPSSPSSDTQHIRTAESQSKAPAQGSASKVESFGKRKPLLQAWVSPSEAHPISAQPGAGAAKHRLHPVKPMNTTATKITNTSLGAVTMANENLISEAMIKKYNPSDPAFAYAQLTHDELIQLVLKQKETISKKEFQVRELEDYIDNLLVRVMEETPNILRVPAQLGKKAGKM